MRTPGAVQTGLWIALGVGAFFYLSWRDGPATTSAAAPPRPRPVFRLDSLPRPFANVKPRIVTPRALTLKPKPAPSRAGAGARVEVSLTAYCLLGSTRSGTETREGIVAADPRVFPLNSELDIEAGGRSLGRFRVEDTGLLIKGTRIDIWLADCSEARSFGRKRGIATLLPKIRR